MADLAQDKGLPQEFWIGLSDEVQEGSLLWVTGESNIYSNWYSGEPNNQGNEDYVEMGHETRYTWNDIPGDFSRPFVVEFEETPSREVALPEGKFYAEYYNNPSLTGRLAFTQNEFKIDHDWGDGSPGSGISTDNFSVRWRGRFPFKGGTYNFIVRTDDGIRVWVDKDLVIDAWHGQSVTTYQQEVALQKGKHIVRVEYYEATGIAIVQVHWARLPPAAISRDGSTDAVPPVMRQPSPRDYADHILTYEPLITPPVPNFANPLRALGPPDNERVSLGGNGSILEVEFTDNILYNGEAADLRVVELGSAEVYDVYVWTNGSFVFLGNGQGSADFDLGRVGIDGPVTIVRIVDRSPAGIGEPSSGSDIDAVIALNSGPLP